MRLKVLEGLCSKVFAVALSVAFPWLSNADRCFVEVEGQRSRLSVYEPRMNFRPQLFLGGWRSARVRVNADAGEGFTAETDNGKALIRCQLSAGQTAEIEQFGICADLDLVSYAGGRVVVDGVPSDIPVTQGRAHVAKGIVRNLALATAEGAAISFGFRHPTRFCLQDNRVFGVSSFELRLAITDEREVQAGRMYSLDFTLESSGGVALGRPAPVVIEADDKWIPFRASPEVAPGSALDFSDVFGPAVPCGAHGRLIAVGDHFEFEGLPGVAQRFCGVNLCYDANFLSPENSRRLVANLRRFGYNAIRLHHHDNGLVLGMSDSKTPNPKALDRLDALLAACDEAGVYVTTDLYVSRQVPFREIGKDLPGSAVEMRAKALIRDDVGMREHFFGFVRNWLNHVNPYTRRRWADEPALAWLSFVNENNPGNPGCGPCDRETMARELELDRAIKKLVRDELGCKALVTSMNGWTNVPGTALPRLEVYDYVDDHYYFDHPEYLDNNWSVPCRCSNILPFSDPRLFKMNCRLFGKPYTISEFNYAYPSKMRGCGGLVMGSMAALQDWSVLWRFAWGHSAKQLRHYEEQRSKFFDLVGDPTNLASERAVLSLFRRGDLRPLTRASADFYSRRYLETDAAYASGGHSCADLIWHDRIGIAVDDCDSSIRRLSVDGVQKVPIRNMVTAKSKVGAQVRANIERGVFSVDTACTQGAFARSGRVSMSALSIDVGDDFATVWAMSLDGAPLTRSRRILLSHLTETVNSGTTFSDRTRTVMTVFGHVPHLMRRGRAECSMTVKPGAYHLYALASNGERVAELPTSVENGRLVFTLDVGSVPETATCCYELVRVDAKPGPREQKVVRPNLDSGVDATEAVQSAIDGCFLAGGGTVRIPKGSHNVKTLRLRSNVTLYLERDAKLIASRQPDDYVDLICRDRVEPLPDSFFTSRAVGVKESTNRWCRAVIRMFKAHDVAIVGEEGSEIDGRNCFDANGEEKFRGPHAICVNLSTNVSLSGYAVRDAGNFAHYVSRSQGVVVRGVTIRGGHDGIDFFHSCDISVEDCDIQSGDDCVAGYGNRNWTIRNCRLNSACSIFRIGGNDVLVDNIEAYGPGKYAHRWTYNRDDLAAGLNPTGYGRRNTLSFFTFFTGKSASRPSGNIVFRNCRVSGVDKLMHLNFVGNEQWQRGPGLHDVMFDSLVAEHLAGPACLYAPAECPVTVRFCNSVVSCENAPGELFRGANVKRFVVDGLEVKGVDGAFLRSWNGSPEWKTNGLKGIPASVEAGNGPFEVKPI